MSIIKPKRGTGSPAGSIATNEIAMDTTSKTLYVSTNGTDAVVLADNTENFLETNTIELDITSDIAMGSNNIAAKKVTGTAFAYGDVSSFTRHNNGQNYPLASVESIRDYDTSDPATGLDDRGAGLSFTIKSDNYNDIYPGAFYAKSGGKDQNAGVENTVGLVAYGAAADSWATYTILEANRNACNMEVPVRFPSYTTTERNALTNVAFGMQVYNTTDNKMQAYVNVSGTTPSWVDLH